MGVFSKKSLKGSCLITLTCFSLSLLSHDSYSDDANTASIGSAVNAGLMIAGGYRSYVTDQATCPAGPGCGFVAVDLAVITAGVGLLGLSLYNVFLTKDNQSSSGIPPPTEQCLANPSLPQCNNGSSELCTSAPEICDCTGANARSNPICNPSDFSKDIPKIKSSIQNGIIPLPEGKTQDEFFSDLDNLALDLNTLNGIATGTLSDSALGELSSIKGSGFGSAKRAGTGDAGKDAFNQESGFGNDSGGIGASLGLLAQANKTVGPSDRSGLGKTLFDGLLNLIDANTGKDLTLWEHNTRRLQSFEDNGKRAFTLARIEQIRQNGIKFKNERNLKKQNSLAKSKKSQNKKTPSKRVPTSAVN